MCCKAGLAPDSKIVFRGREGEERRGEFDPQSMILFIKKDKCLKNDTHPTERNTPRTFSWIPTEHQIPSCLAFAHMPSRNGPDGKGCESSSASEGGFPIKSDASGKNTI